jgi:hypothetical protein
MSGQPALSLRDSFPLRLLINGEDCTFLVDEDFTFSNTDPGGFESASFPIPKDMPQVLRGDPVRLECGLATAWEGRVKEVQRSLGSKTLIQCEGNIGKLKDDQMSMVYVDRDLTRWGSPGAGRAVLLAEANDSQGSAEVGADAEGVGTEADLPALIQTISGSWASPWKPLVESWYDAGPENLIDKIYFAMKQNPQALSLGVFLAEAFLSIDQLASTVESTGNMGASDTVLFNPATSYRFAGLTTFAEATPSGVAGAEYQVFWRNLAVYGNHGLTLRGPEPGGLYTSDIVTHALSQCEGVKAGVIQEATQYIVPHAPFYLPVPVEQVIAEMAKMAGWHMGVWESLTYLAGNQEPRLDFRAYPEPGNPTAWCWREECETLDIREDIENLYDRAQVTFTEPGGDEGAVLVGLANPALQEVGLHRTVNIAAGTSTKEAAEAYGLIQLRLLSEQANVTGSATITEAIHEMSGVAKPAWMLRAGLDRLRIPDLPSSDVWGAHNDLPIGRVECSGGEQGLSTSVEFGTGPNLIETLNAQLQAAVTAAG